MWSISKTVVITLGAKGLISKFKLGKEVTVEKMIDVSETVSAGDLFE